jgi:hypothetical protein
MQSLGTVTTAQLKASVQVPLMKFEIWYGGAWVNLCSLGGKNYLEGFSVSLGGATMTPDPVAGTWSATIDNPDGRFFPANTGGAYYDYFTTGRKVRISTGGTFSGSDKYWNRLVGVMDSPKFTLNPSKVELQGMDYCRYLEDYKLRLPNNYWGNVTTISTIGPVEADGTEIYAEADACEIGAGEANNVTNWAAAGAAAVSSAADAGGGSTYVMKILFGTGAVVKTYSTAGSFTWTCPPGVTSIQVQCWGAGGGGGASASFWCDGGGGGAYSKSTAITVVPGTIYTIQVGSGGAKDFSGGDSYFINKTTILAKGGQAGASGAASGTKSLGGAAASGVGDTKYSGGRGGYSTLAGEGGAGGGSSAGTASNGNNGSPDNGGNQGGNGGGAPTGGGAGGKGGDTGNHGINGSTPGGGGGGAGLNWSISGGSGAAGKVILSYTGANDTDSIYNSNVGAVVANTMYKVAFKYKCVTGPGSLTAGAYIGTTQQDGQAGGLTAAAYTAGWFYFVASDSGNLQLNFDISGASTGTEFRVDVISVKPVITITYTHRYDLPAECTGVYYAVMDGEPIYYGEDPYGWFYDATYNQFVFHPGRAVQAGTNNLVVYYHTAQTPVNVVADLLVAVGLYAQQSDALAAMSYTETGIVIDRVWFEAGTSVLDAIRLICERCDYRFYFKYDGTPSFNPKPTADAPGNEDAALLEYHIADPTYYEDSAEVWNVVTIEGESIAQPLGTEQTMAPNYKGTISDITSIAAYGDRTKSIQNHLFQSDAICLSMATAMLALYKDPKKYLDFNARINVYPIELGDTLSTTVLLSAHDDYAPLKLALRGVVRDIKLSGVDATYKLEMV